MLKLVGDRWVKSTYVQGNRTDAYQQALDDFGITQLLSYIRHYSDSDFDTIGERVTEQELESIVALLIQQLTFHLQGSVLANYLNILRTCPNAMISDLPPSELQANSPPHTLPPEFPQSTAPPLFWFGDRVRWIPLDGETQTDTGIVIGSFFAYAQHQAQWAWKYFIWLLGSSNLVLSDTAWEQDIEPWNEKGAI